MDEGSSDEAADEAAVQRMLRRPPAVGGVDFGDEDDTMPPAPTQPPPTPPSQASGAPPSDKALLHAHLLDVQAELEQTRAIVGAARLRSVLRSRRALALGRAWTAWTHVSLAGHHAARAEPLMRELSVLRAEVASQRDRSADLQQLREQVAEARSSDGRLQREQAQAHKALMSELSSTKLALAESQAQAAAFRDEGAAMQEELDGAAGTLRDGFAEAAAQGARLAAEEHTKQQQRTRLLVIVQSSHAARIAHALHGWKVAAAAIFAEHERASLRTSKATLEHELHLCHRRLDGLHAEKSSLEAAASARDREMEREATALRSALLAAAPQPFAGRPSAALPGECRPSVVPQPQQQHHLRSAAAATAALQAAAAASAAAAAPITPVEAQSHTTHSTNPFREQSAPYSPQRLSPDKTARWQAKAPQQQAPPLPAVGPIATAHSSSPPTGRSSAKSASLASSARILAEYRAARPADHASPPHATPDTQLTAAPEAASCSCQQAASTACASAAAASPPATGEADEQQAANGSRTRGGGVPPEVSAELMRLRRKLSDLSADNGLLTQNFLMVQARYREVAGQRDEERKAQDKELSRRADAAENQLSTTRSTLTAILRSEVSDLEGGLRKRRAAAAAVALGRVIRGRVRARLEKFLLIWSRGVHAHTARHVGSLQRARTASENSISAARSKELSDAIRHVLRVHEGRTVTAGLAHAMRMWKLGMVAAQVAKLTTRLDNQVSKSAAANIASEQSLVERQGMLDAERVHSEALGKEMQQLAEHARAVEKQAQQAQLDTFSVTREKDAIAAKVAEAELQQQLLKNQLDMAAEERRRSETAREALQKERDLYLTELRQVESEARVINATTSQDSASAQQHHARLLAEVTDLRSRLGTVEATRDRERQQMSSALSTCARLQGQLTQQKQHTAELLTHGQRREASTIHAAQARMDNDAHLQFNAEILAFARTMHVNMDSAAAKPRSRQTSPLQTPRY